MEALILYFVLFFPGIYASPFPEWLANGTEGALSIPFSLLRELGRTLTYTVPSLALLWYLLSDRNGFSALKEVPINKNDIKQDLIPFAIGFPGLIIIGIFISLMVTHFSGLTPPPKVEAPATIPGWFVMVFSCLGTGYLEESYFRYYLLKSGIPAVPENLIPEIVLRIVISTLLFSLCHLYEGPWGVVNAILAGVLLSVLFIRFRSLHGIAWAHGAYNIFVYTMGSII